MRVWGVGARTLVPFFGTPEAPETGGVVTAPTAVLIRPDGYVAWVGDGTNIGLRDALTTWFGSSGSL
jgi:3-(3-hydroxy-phenyl)propionate hydroxylase